MCSVCTSVWVSELLQLQVRSGHASDLSKNHILDSQRRMLVNIELTHTRLWGREGRSPALKGVWRVGCLQLVGGGWLSQLAQNGVQLGWGRQLGWGAGFSLPLDGVVPNHLGRGDVCGQTHIHTDYPDCNFRTDVKAGKRDRRERLAKDTRSPRSIMAVSSLPRSEPEPTSSLRERARDTHTQERERGTARGKERLRDSPKIRDHHVP